MQGDNCNNTVPNRDVPIMRWDKADTASYRYTTFCNLASLVNYDCLDSCGKDCQCRRLHVIDEFYFLVVQALQRSDPYTVPRRKTHFYNFWWDVEATELKDEVYRCP